MRPANYITWAASALGAASGLFAQVTASQSSQVASAGLTVAIGSIATAASTILLALIKGYWDDRAAERMDRRAERQRQANFQGQLDQHKREAAEARMKADLAETKVHQAIQETDELRRQLGDVTANKARIDELDLRKADAVAAAANAGKLEVVLRKLEAAGEIVPHRGGTGNKSRVLVVGEDPGITEIFSDAFTELGFKVQAVGKVKDAIEAIRAKPPHWVVLNLILADGSGLDVLRFVREQELPSKVAVVTRVTDDAIMAQLRDLKPDHFQHRPTDLQKLVKAIDPSLELKR